MCKCNKCNKEKSLSEFSEKKDGSHYKVCDSCREKVNSSYIKKDPKVDKNTELCGDNIETFKCSRCDNFYPEGMGGFKTCQKCRDSNRKSKQKNKPVPKPKKLETIPEKKVSKKKEPVVETAIINGVETEITPRVEFRTFKNHEVFGLGVFRKNKFNLVMDEKTFIIYGKYLYEDSTIHQLSKDDIELCKKYDMKYSVNDARAVPLKTEEEKLAEAKAKRAEEKAEKKKEQDERKMIKKIAQATIKDIDNRDKKNVDKLLKDMKKSSPAVRNLIDEAIKEKEVEDKEYEEENYYSESDSDVDVSD